MWQLLLICCCLITVVAWRLLFVDTLITILCLPHAMHTHIYTHIAAVAGGEEAVAQVQPGLGAGINPALVQSLSAGEGGRWVAAGAHNGSVHVLTFNNNKVSGRKGTAAFAHAVQVPGAHTGSASQVHSPCWNGSGSVISGGDDAQLRFWKVW